ncbi:LutC/YkgG family protein [Haloparvum sp. PAK95]|uniref:LutC/YkgG family protein n=1 Tax=Haloparvum sp. PAK95 TaxID=3418962 RepID=UPI003D2F34A7
MTGSSTSAFVDALDELDVSLSRTTPESCADAVADALAGEAVGVPLHHDLDLPEEVHTDPTNGDLESAETGVTPATFGIAETGSIYLKADHPGTEPISLYPYRHVAVLREADLVPDVPAAVDRVGPELRDGNSGIIATGPSATADMGALVVGAHGPGEVHVVLVEEANA